MKQNLLNLKSWLLMMCLLVGVGSAWAETKSIEINTTNSGVTGSYADKTFDVNDVTFGFTQWMKNNNIQAKKSTTNSCYNVDAIPGNIKKITVVQTGTARAIKIYGGTSSKPTTEITAPSTAATMEFDFSEKSYTYFSMTTPGNAVYINTITIEYETSSGDTPTPEPTKYNVTVANDIANGTVTADPTSAKEGDDVTLTATPADGYEFGSWNVTNASTSAAITVTDNKFTMPAADVNVSATFNKSRPANEIFYESFDKNTGTGGNDGSWNGSIANSDITYDNDGWQTNNCKGANKCAKFGTGSAKGWATTPALGVACDATLTFKAAAWDGNSESTTLKLSVIDGGDISDATVTLKKGEWTTYTVTLTNLTAASKVKFEGNAASNSRFFLDEVSIVKTGEVKALSSIAVKTAPTKVIYTEDEKFDPAGLVITATYDDESTEDIAYEGNESKFTFNPALTDALTTSNTSVTITYNEKYCTQEITVNAIPTYTLTITQPAEGGTLTVKNGDVTLENGATVRVGTNLTCEVTGIPEGKRFSRFYAKWGEGDGESKYKMTNPATFDNIATESISACEIYVTYKDILYYTINYKVNGVIIASQENVEEKTTLTFPTAPATLGEKTFVGWVETDFAGTTDEEPSFVDTSNQIADKKKTYYAVYAAQGEGSEGATYTKATSLAVGDKVVFGLGEANDKPEQAVTGASNGATISATESEWIVYTATTYEGKNGIVLQKEDGDYQRSASSSFDFTSNNPSTFETNASSYIIGYGRWTLYSTPQGNRFYETKGTDYVEFLMWKVDGGVSYSGYTTTPLGTTTITLTATNGTAYYATFVSKNAIVMPEGLTGAAAGDYNDEIAWNWMYEPGSIVPAETPILVKGAESGDYAAPLTIADGTAPTSNLLFANNSDATRAASDIATGASKFYTLSYDNATKTKLGFYWRVDGGASFDVPAGKVFLALPNSMGAKAAYLLSDDSATSINSVESTNIKNNAIYNLNGQRISSANGFKGIIIVNGKKMLNK